MKDQKLPLMIQILDLAINDILERYCTWEKVDREAKDKDQVIIDFEGKIDGEPFEGNESKDFKLVLGSKSMIPGFEDNLVVKNLEIAFLLKQIFLRIILKKILLEKKLNFLLVLMKFRKCIKQK